MIENRNKAKFFAVFIRSLKKSFKLEWTSYSFLAVVSFGISRQLSRFGFYAVEEWAVYSSRIPLRATWAYVSGDATSDPRFRFGAGSLSFLPFNWITSFIEFFIRDPVTVIRISIAIPILATGLSTYLFIKQFVESRMIALSSAVFVQTSLYTIIGWTSTPKAYSIPLFVTIFIYSSTKFKSRCKSILVGIAIFTPFVSVVANPPALIASMLGFPLGAIYGFFVLRDQSNARLKAVINELATKSIALVLIFAPWLYVQYREITSKALPSQIFDYTGDPLKNLLLNIAGRGYWWEYAGSEGFRFNPFIDALDLPLVWFGRYIVFLIAALGFIYFVVEVFGRRLIQRSRKINDVLKAKQVIAFYSMAIMLLIFSGPQDRVPFFVQLGNKFKILQMFREPLPKFNGIYIWLLAITFAAILGYISTESAVKKRRFKFVKPRLLVYALSSFILISSLIPITQSSFSFEKGSIYSVPLERVRLAHAIANRINTEKIQYCVTVEGYESGGLPQEAANSLRILMIYINGRSDSWLIPGTISNESTFQCKPSEAVVVIERNGEFSFMESHETQSG